MLILAILARRTKVDNRKKGLPGLLRSDSEHADSDCGSESWSVLHLMITTHSRSDSGITSDVLTNVSSFDFWDCKSNTTE